MKIAICGSRHFNFGPEALLDLASTFFPEEVYSKLGTEIVSGAAEGIDFAAKQLAEVLECKLKEFEPDWNKYGKAAGPIRNKQIAEYADCLLLIWNGTSLGSKSCKTEFEKLNKPVYEIVIDWKMSNED
jgi:hypothetical protein